MNKIILYALGLLNLVVAYIISAYWIGHVFQIQVFIYLFVIWLISAFLTDKYYLKYTAGYFTYHLTPAFKAFIIMLMIISLTILLDVFDLKFITLLSVIVFLTILDMIVRYGFFIIYSPRSKKELLEYKAFSFDSNSQEDLNYEESKVLCFNPLEYSDHINEAKLQVITKLLSENKIDTTSRKSSPSIIDKEQSNNQSNNNIADIYCLNVLLNDIQNIDKKLKQITSTVNPGGWLIVEYRPLHIVEEKIKQMPASKFLYLPYFFFKRILPKIPGINKIYSTFTRGRNKVISQTETWGRLIYLGFEVIKEVPFDDYFIIIAKRIKTISLIKKPSFYPIIKLNRVGFMGKIVQIYKVRSMYPFSEFLQNKIFEDKGMSNTGHFNDDSRITNYGNIIRKLWIDELPQLLHWLRGDIKLVGIRAMSLQYFNIHSKEYQAKFIRVMPGLVPPIFDSSITSFAQLVKIEEDYLDSYIKNRIKTDLKYFFATFNDIVFKGIRSS